MVHNYSYAVVRLWDWLDMLNASLNPLEREITAGDLDLVYRDGQGYAGTQGLRGSAYYRWSAPAASIPAAVPPSPTPEPPSGPKVIPVFPGA